MTRDESSGAGDEAVRACVLRAGMVEELREREVLGSDWVDGAFRTVPRRLFAPDAPLEEAYAAHRAVVTKRDEHDIAVSSVFAPWLRAVMLGQARLAPGMRVLEIGSGGYNVALVAEVVGEEGEVTTVDIDPEVADRARHCLAAAGYDQVNVMLADAEEGVPEHAPYDRVIVTAGAWDIPPAWMRQLVDGGLLVVPLRMRGLTRSVALEYADGRLVSRDYRLCGVVACAG